MRDESRSRIHRSRAADGDEQIALVQLLEDPVHAERHLSEPDHVRTQSASTPIAAWRNAVVSALVGERRPIAGIATSSIRCSSQSPPASRKVRTPLSALIPAPVRTKTRSFGPTASAANSSPRATFGSGTIRATELRDGRPQARIFGMAVAALRRELSRRMYVRSRVARAGAVRLAYLAYSRALLRWEDRSSPEAAGSLRRRLEELFDEDFRDAEAGYYPRSLIDTIPWREYAQAVPRLLADLPRTRARMGRGDFRELPENAAPDRYPGYYARNFHYQTDGY